MILLYMGVDLASGGAVTKAIAGDSRSDEEEHHDAE
jgi:hypothetical protein